MIKLSDLTKDYKTGQVEKGVDYEYQEICKKLELIFGKDVWIVIHEKGNNNDVMREVYRRWTEEKRKGYLRWLIKEIKK